MSKKKLKWYRVSDDHVIAESNEVNPYHYAPNCPLCGARTEYSEYVLDQDRMGNEIWGWSYDCFSCGISSENLG